MAEYPLLAETPSWLPPALFALGCAMATMILLRRSFRHFGKRTWGGSGPHIVAQPRPKTPWEGSRQDTEARFNRQQVELHELARDLTGQLDSKIVILRELVAQSERQIEQLEALLGETAEKGTADERR